MVSASGKTGNAIDSRSIQAAGRFGRGWQATQSLDDNNLSAQDTTMNGW